MPGGPVNGAGPAGIIPVGGSLVTICAGIASPTAGNRQPFTKFGASSQVFYSATGSAGFTAIGMLVSSDTTVVSAIAFGHNPSTFASNSAVAGTDIYYGADNTMGSANIHLSLTASVPTYLAMPLFFPTGVFPFVRTSITNPFRVILFGYIS